jgi:hypothetical protein
LALSLAKAEVIWREFLKDKQSDTADFAQYLFLLNSLAERPAGEVPINFSSWILRGAGAGIWHHPGRCRFAWGLLGSIAVVGLATPLKSIWLG